MSVRHVTSCCCHAHEDPSPSPQPVFLAALQLPLWNIKFGLKVDPDALFP